MRLIIAGSRGFDLGPEYIGSALDALSWVPDVVVSGTARGADRQGELYAEDNGIEVERYPANWNKYGRSAGYKRNEVMARNATHLLALWDGKSRGTKHMIDLAHKHGLKVKVVNYSGEMDS